MRFLPISPAAFRKRQARGRARFIANRSLPVSSRWLAEVTHARVLAHRAMLRARPRRRRAMEPVRYPEWMTGGPCR